MCSHCPPKAKMEKKRVKEAMVVAPMGGMLPLWMEQAMIATPTTIALRPIGYAHGVNQMAMWPGGRSHSHVATATARWQRPPRPPSDQSQVAVANGDHDHCHSHHLIIARWPRPRPQPWPHGQTWSLSGCIWKLNKLMGEVAGSLDHAGRPLSRLGMGALGGYVCIYIYIYIYISAYLFINVVVP